MEAVLARPARRRQTGLGTPRTSASTTRLQVILCICSVSSSVEIITKMTPSAAYPTAVLTPAALCGGVAVVTQFAVLAPVAVGVMQA